MTRWFSRNRFHYILSNSCWRSSSCDVPTMVPSKGIWCCLPVNRSPRAASGCSKHLRGTGRAAVPGGRERVGMGKTWPRRILCPLLSSTKGFSLRYNILLSNCVVGFLTFAVLHQGIAASYWTIGVVPRLEIAVETHHVMRFRCCTSWWWCVGGCGVTSKFTNEILLERLICVLYFLAHVLQEGAFA